MRMRRPLWPVLAAFGVVVAVASPAHAQEDGKKLFTSVTPACALCHRLKDAGAEGQIGPSLDELKPDAARVMKALRVGIGQMPAFPQLTEEQIKALAVYVDSATK
jgi:cytochrome c6